ncbi:hypothetical protein VP1G_10810 [Cytospora mali]|uniref:Uncharacterized protein n=1 Tax=Cytospora mali TaxID=578113 RepID=A0A194UXB9_CYTMA|nr:hypothetical protein VP1G_10810 [Valsa mali var. pyri (nom. inval.)]
MARIPARSIQILVARSTALLSREKTKHTGHSFSPIKRDPSVVTELHQTFPADVPRQAVDDLKNRGTALTRLTALRDRVQPPPPRPRTPPNAPESGVRFSLDS